MIKTKNKIDKPLVFGILAIVAIVIVLMFSSNQTYKILPYTAFEEKDLNLIGEASELLSKGNIKPLKLAPNVFVIEDDGVLASNVNDPSVLTRKFYEIHPKDKYDFIGFHFKDVVLGGRTYSYTVQDPAEKGHFGGIVGNFVALPNGSIVNRLEHFGSKGRLLGGYVDSFDFNKTHVKRISNDPIELLDNFYFSLLFHELTHYWGVSLPEQLKEAMVFDGTNYLYGHWEFFTGSWVAVRDTTRLKLVENQSGYYFRIDCSLEPRHHDFDLYSMGLIAPEGVKEKLVVTNRAGQIPGPLECDTVIEVKSDFIRKSYTIQDMIDVLGPRAPSANASQKDFKMAFVMIVPKGSTLSKEEISALNWISRKFPITWHKSTKGKSTLNKIKPNELKPPIISNVRTSSTNSSITVNWTTNEPVASFVIYKDPTLMSRIYPAGGFITNPPKYSKKHDITINSSNDFFMPVLPNTAYPVKIISIDENYNLASFDVGVVRTK